MNQSSNVIEIKLNNYQIDALQDFINKSLTNILTGSINKTIENSRYLNKQQACKYAGISYNTLQQWLKDGLPYYRINNITRISLLEIDHWIRLHRQKGSVTNETLDYNKSVV